MNTSIITSEQVRNFLLTRYADRITGGGKTQAEIPDTFDFLLEGIIDSFGVLEMVGAVEEKFGIELDMSGLVAEELTVLGPLARYVAVKVSTQRASEGSDRPSA